MRISKEIISQYIPKIYDIDDKTFIDICNAIGIEVETIIKHPFIKNVVVGQIVSLESHPNAESLSLCKVSIGENSEPLTIVCGAKNIKDNDKVIVALDQCVLHNGKKIERTKIRDVISEGMICAYSELTPHNSEFLSNEDINGVVILDDNAIVGDTNPLKYVGLNDTIYELTLPSNRNDLNGVISFCSDFAGYVNLPFVWPKINMLSGVFDSDLVINFDKKVCRGCHFLQIKNIPYRQTSWSLKRILINNGVKPIGTIVDDFVMITLLTNVPLAIYDTDKLPSTNISIQLPTKQYSFIGFNDKQYSITENDIIVMSNNEILSLAGIIGNKQYGVGKETTNITIEIANFDYVRIRETSLKLNIATSAAKSNSRNMSAYFLSLATSLIYHTFHDAQISKINGEVILSEHEPIQVDINYICSLLGLKLSVELLSEHLSRFGFNITNNICHVPIYRIDIVNNNDLAEEILKLININDIPYHNVLTEGLIAKNEKDEYLLEKNIKNVLINNCFNEVKTYNLVPKDSLNNFNIFRNNDCYLVANSNNNQREVLRFSLIDALLNVYSNNNKRKTLLVPIFELQTIYAKSYEKNLTMIISDSVVIDHLSKSKICVNVNYLKMILLQIAEITNAEISFHKVSENSYFYPNETVVISYYGETIGYIGAIKQTQLAKYDLQNKNIYCLTINLTRLISDFKQKPFIYQSQSNTMPVIKDISFIVGHTTPLNELQSIITKLDFVKQVEFIDQYQISDTTRSYTIRVVFSNITTLTTEEINKYLKKIEQVIIENHGSIRK